MLEESNNKRHVVKSIKINPSQFNIVKINSINKDIQPQQDQAATLSQDNTQDKINNEGDIKENMKVNQQSEMLKISDSQSGNNDLDNDAAKLIIRDDISPSQNPNNPTILSLRPIVSNCLRIYCQRIMSNRWFNICMAVLVLINSVLLAFQDYSYRLENKNSENWRNKLIAKANPIFLSFYILEFLITITAKGVILAQFTYFRNGWNILDFIILCSGDCSNLNIAFMNRIGIMIPEISSIDFIQALWMLIPLKLIGRIPGARNLVYGLFIALNKISNVGLFLVFVILIFALFGLQFYEGIFENRCRTTPTPINGIWLLAENTDFLCGSYTCPTNTYCGNPAKYGISRNWTEDNIEALYWGIPNFDSVYNATLTVFQTITPTGWYGLMMMYAKGFDSVITRIYFILIICFVTFYVINLILAVITDSFMVIMNEIEPENESNKVHHNDNVEEEGNKEDKLQIPNKEDQEQEQEVEEEQDRDIEDRTKVHRRSNSIIDHDSNISSINFKKTLSINEKSKLLNGTNTYFKGKSLPKKDDSVQMPMITSNEGGNISNRVKERLQREEEMVEGNNNNNVVLSNMESNNHQLPKRASSPFSPSSPSSFSDSPSHSLFPTPKFTTQAYANFQKFMSSPKFEIFSMLAILSNAILLALNRYPQPKSEEKIIRNLTNFFTFYFLLEIILKIIAMGLKKYLKDMLNIFDFVLVCITIVEFSVVYSGIQGSGLNIINGLRSLKLLSLGRRWKPLRNLYIVLIHTLNDVRYFAIVLILFIMSAALIGMQFFSYRARFIEEELAQNPALGESPRLNFDKFYNAYITVLCIVLNEVWPEIMYNYMRATSSPAALYFVIIVIIGNLILLKLFMAIIIENYSKVIKKEDRIMNPKSIIQHKIIGYKQKLSICWEMITQCKNKKQEEKNKKKKIKVFSSHLTPINENSNTTNPLKILIDDDQNPSSPPHPLTNITNNNNPNNIIKLQKTLLPPISSSKNSKNQKKVRRNHHNFDVSLTLISNNALIPSKSEQQIKEKTFNSNQEPIKIHEEKKKILKDMEYDPITQKFVPKTSFIKGKSLCLFNDKSKLRHLLLVVKHNKVYSIIVFLAIIINTVSVAIETPYADPAGLDQVICYYLDIVTATIFTIDIIIKSIVYGFWFNGQKSFLMSKWHWLDLLIVIFCWLNIWLENFDDLDLSIVFIVNAIRSMRPLTLISQNGGLILAIKSIFSAIPSILNLSLVIIIFFIFFSIFGVAYFKGEFYHCDLSNLSSEFNSKIFTKLDCMDYGGDWVNDPNNFDNTFIGMITIFKISTTNGWTNLMFLGIDSVDADMNPKKNYDTNWCLFYICFVILGVCFILNFFVALVVDFFAHEKKRIGGLTFLTEEQREWLELKLELVNLRPHSSKSYPQNLLSKKLRSIVESNAFNNAITIFLILNTLVFCLIWTRQDEAASSTLSKFKLNISISQLLDLGYANIVFVVCFCIEAIMKIIAWSYYYFQDGWNCFDFSIVILALISKLLDYGLNLSSNPISNIIRTFRCARILRLMIRLERLKLIYTTIIITLPAMLNIAAFLALVLFIYLNIGNSLFCFIKYGDGITNDVNFQTFHGSLLALLKIATLEEWYAIFDDCKRPIQPNNACTDINSYHEYLKYGKELIEEKQFFQQNYYSFQQKGLQDCGTPWAYPFFLSFQYLFTLIFINLFIAIIINAYQKCSELDKNPIKRKDLDEFKRLWNKYDPKGNSLISHHNLEELIFELQPPLGRPILKEHPFHLQRFIGKLHIPAYTIHEDQQNMLYHHFNDVLFALAKEFYQDHHKLEDDLEQPSSLSSQLIYLFFWDLFIVILTVKVQAIFQ